MKWDEHLREKCKEQTEDPVTDINPECIRAAMEAMFMDRYNVTVTYNDKVVVVYLYRFCFLARGWTVRDAKPDEGKTFRTHLNRPRSPSSLLYNGYRISFHVVQRPGRGVDNPVPPSADVKERVDQCLYFPPWAFIAFYRENLGFFVYFLLLIRVFTFFIYSYLLSFFLYFFLYFFFINLTIFLLLVYTCKVNIGT